MKTQKEWDAHYRSCSMRELRQHVGQSMGLSTSGTRRELIARIERKRAQQ